MPGHPRPHTLRESTDMTASIAWCIQPNNVLALSATGM
ncbi:MAG: hypothetical protein OJF49_000969 [Ktedonobacterales bacterium]|nr:MAG: hypothetical protein OJF49_000969 [Ktedonobacterales bacterium]